MINESLANQSNVLMYGAMAAYTCSFFSFALDLAGGVAVTERKVRRAANIAVALTLVAAALHLAAVVARGIATERAPWGNMYEFSTAGAVVVTIIYLASLKWRDLRYLGVFVVGPVLLTLGLAVRVFYIRAEELVPALQSPWLVVHVSLAFIAAALFTIAFSLTVLYLIQLRLAAGLAAGKPARRTIMSPLPSAAELDSAAHRLHMLAFPLWTFTVVGGAMWAEQSWGRYWGWDPKEVWSFVIWVVYAAYLHARATRGWQGKKASWIALAGFACILINFLVINVFVVGKHSYGGVG